MTSRVGIALLSLLLLIPLVVGAAVAGLHDWRPGPATSAVASASDATASDAAVSDAAAPQSPGKGAGAGKKGTGTDKDAAKKEPAEPALKSPADIRRAAGEAQAQAGFLVSGTELLKDGTEKLSKGAPELAEGTRRASEGAQKLREGMIQLQAGTGQLGDGATQLADGVGTAVDNVVGINVVRGQLLTSIDSTLADLKDNNSAEAKDIRRTLGSLRNQVENFELDTALTDKLTKLKEGSRELANQLDVSGYAYHDGVYEATEGSKQLAAGLAELNAGVEEALAGAKELNDGAKKVDTLANNTKKKNDALAKYLQAESAAGRGSVNGGGNSSAGGGATGGDASSADASAANAGHGHDIAGRSAWAGAAPASLDQPALLELHNRLIAVLLASMMLLAGVAIGGGWTATHGFRAWLLVVLGGIGAVGAGLVGTTLFNAPTTPQAWAITAGIFACTVLCGVFGTRLAQRVFGAGLGLVLAAVTGLGQMAAVGWLWRESIQTTFTGATWFGLNLLPLNWSVAGLHGATGAYLWGCLAVLGAVAIIGLVLSGLARPRPAVQVVPSPPVSVA
ncbi:hypothetical protein [Corynebacterium phocae]|uniref:hypothetical protein n=1 Tax=Corynebacterium phocae TaxID=161895 RepID=UPI000951330E|nr:hypothetical protein [Corynebacterium phocae]